ncbi:uncharacterized protein C8R40DRAFT_1173610 [Lentinula edodes]|uniref:uncharacterized protein n=1 Tax=Lentinula edodes TaxID=5353 RepID=UPI001E8CD297|nr:uncharacterized protein C8R40DRAFT_1173610 [Lentinula edodes]KAH7872535.1 hypothetical protein C8R40DRAFT_1173610 [Lentinula edodes]
MKSFFLVPPSSASWLRSLIVLSLLLSTAFSNATCAAAPVSPTNELTQDFQNIPLNTNVKVWILRQDTPQKADPDKWWISFGDQQHIGVTFRAVDSGPSRQLEEYTAEKHRLDGPLSWILLGEAYFPSGNVMHDILGKGSIDRLLAASRSRQGGHGGGDSPSLMFIQGVWKSLEEKKVMKTMTGHFDKIMEGANHVGSSSSTHLASSDNGIGPRPLLPKYTIPTNADVKVWLLRQDRDDPQGELNPDDWWISFGDSLYAETTFRRAADGHGVEEYATRKHASIGAKTWILLGVARFPSHDVMQNIFGDGPMNELLAASCLQQGGGPISHPSLRFIEGFWKRLEEKKVIESSTGNLDKILKGEKYESSWSKV